MNSQEHRQDHDPSEAAPDTTDTQSEFDKPGSSGCSTHPNQEEQDPSEMRLQDAEETLQYETAKGTASAESGDSMSQEAVAQSIKPILGNIDSKLDRVVELFQDRMIYDAAKEEAIRRLGGELSAYRDDFFRRQQLPMFRDLVLLFDSMARVFENLAQEDPPVPRRMLDRLDVLLEELLEVLARQDVYPFGQSPEYLDPKLHRTIRVDKAEHEQEHNRIQEVVRTGFMWGDTVLRPEEVVIKKFERTSEK